ncbi:MAG: hypothetical protein E7281_04170 [Lachnospiraceae bacterium]|nr:hypothetical protein [Lachnospiraceae bacterium]
MAVQLNFREKGIPKHVKVRIEILLVIFVLAMIVFQFVLNRGKSTTAMNMDDATLPVVEVDAFGKTVAELHGYTSEMDACYMRDAIVPLDSERNMNLRIDTYGYEIDSVSYEIRSLNTERKIADTKLENLDLSSEEIQTQIMVENLVDADEEYLFILKLHGQDQDIYYYVRVLYPQDLHIKECLDFADDFRSKAMSPQYEELASYVETSDYVDKDTLAEVTIQSSIDQIGWKNFKGQVVADPVVEITDVNDSYISVVYNYQMQDENMNYYNVAEYFKLRYTAEQIYLLDYKRTMDQILTTGNVEVANNILTLGVVSGDLEYLSNETGNVVSFVQAGELFEYDQNVRKLTKVYGFINTPTDVRERYNQHNVRILNIDENGNMDFVVYGYMNRGKHEGQCGINLYHYDAAESKAIEQVFISTSHPYQILNANFSDLLYENVKGDFYIMYGGTLAKVGMDKLNTEELVTNLKSDQYAVSQSGQYVAWVEAEGMAEEIYVMNLETEEIRTIQAPSGTLIKPLAFMTEDLVYGVANKGDIRNDAAGSVIYAMANIKIVSTVSDFEELKDYKEDGFYVTEVNKDGYTLYLDRVSLQGDTYVAAEQDTIKDSAGLQNKMIDIAIKADSARGEITSLVMSELPEDKTITSVTGATSDLAKASGAKDLTIVPSSTQETYFVYVGNEIVLTTQNLTKAISRADEDMAIVIDNQQNYIWKRGKAVYVNAFQDVEVGSMDANSDTSAGALSAMLSREKVNIEVHSLLSQGETPMAILQENLEDALVLDLTGCTLNEVLYYVNSGVPVYARTGDNSAILIIGYDAANIIYYKSDTDTYAKMSTDEATKLFESAGSVYISYVK